MLHVLLYIHTLLYCALHSGTFLPKKLSISSSFFNAKIRSAPIRKIIKIGQNSKSSTLKEPEIATLYVLPFFDSERPSVHYLKAIISSLVFLQFISVYRQLAKKSFFEHKYGQLDISSGRTKYVYLGNFKIMCLGTLISNSD